jgi:A/G-specific adenine glycosylase
MDRFNKKISALVSRLQAWFAANARDLPWRRTHDPYAVWVSEIMLQQTQVKTVIPYWERWMKALPTIANAAQAPSDQIHKLWEGLGYYTRVRNLQKAAQVIVSEHAGKFPEEFEAVLALPGIGRYTAGAICSIAFNQPTPILDGNVIRVLTRVFGIAENPKEKATNARLWELAEALVKESAIDPSPATTNPKPHAPSPVPRASFLNQSLMELGALICTPRSPQCLLCPVQKLCVAFHEGRTEELPNLGKRTISTTREFMAFVLEHQGEVLVRQRPAGVVNAHLWEFPNVEHQGKSSDPAAIFRELFQIKPPVIKPLQVVKHSITRYRITLSAHRATLVKRSARLNGTWVKIEELAELAFASAHKKIAKAL